MKAQIIGDNRSPQNPGEFSYLRNEANEVVGMVICLPDGDRGRIRFKNHPQAGELPTWEWNGNVENPTLTPSIDASYNGRGWHGWLTDGIFRSC